MCKPKSGLLRFERMCVDLLSVCIVLSELFAIHAHLNRLYDKMIEAIKGQRRMRKDFKSEMRAKHQVPPIVARR